jgi:hypothetical protein
VHIGQFVDPVEIIPDADMRVLHYPQRSANASARSLRALTSRSSVSLSQDAPMLNGGTPTLIPVSRDFDFLQNLISLSLFPYNLATRY